MVKLWFSVMSDGEHRARPQRPDAWSAKLDRSRHAPHGPWGLFLTDDVWRLGKRGARRVAGLPFSGPLAGDGLGWSGANVSPLVMVRCLSHHANGFCARQPRYPPSTDLDALQRRGGSLRLEADSQISRQRSSRYYGFAL